MKKFQKFIAKIRIAINIWALWRQIKIHEKITDRFEEDIRAMQRKVNRLEFFLVDKPSLDKELQKLRQEAAVQRELVAVEKNQITSLHQKLIA